MITKNIVGALSLLLIAACSPTQSVPTEADAQKVRDEIARDHGEVIDFKKTNGLAQEVQGIKSYVVLLRAATRIPPGYYSYQYKTGWAVDPSLAGKWGGIHKGKSPSIFVDSTPVVDGSIYAINAEAVFQATEKGWVLKDWKAKRHCYCRDPDALVSVQACYKSCKWE